MLESKVAEVLHLVKNISSTIEKSLVLHKNKDLEGLKEVLHFIYNPYVKSGISKAKFLKALDLKVEVNERWDTFAIINFLSNNQTGSYASLIAVAKYIKCMKAAESALVDWLAEGIVTQELKIGADVKTLNSVFGANFIPVVGCMLGTDISKVKLDGSMWPMIVTEKFDGTRRILIKQGNSCRFFSRSGIEDTGLIEIEQEAQHLPNNTVFDGELLAVGMYEDSIALRQATNSIANSKGAKLGVIFNIFDVLPVDEFFAGKSTAPAYQRKAYLAALFKDDGLSYLVDNNQDTIHSMFRAIGIDHNFQFIQAVPILGVVRNMDEVTPIISEIWKLDGEGVMLNTYGGLYEVKRSKNLLKVKYTEDHELQVIDMVEGQGKFEGMLGALIVDYKGNRLGVGSGFDESTRRHVWDNQSDYIGKIVDIETFGESKNSLGEVSLNCPIFKGFV